MAILTQKLATVVALEVAKKAGFLKLGSKDYFSSQINGKMKAGQSYDFIIPDAGNVVSGLVASPRAIDERKVTLTIENYNNSVQTNALEGITDLKWEDEVAEQYAAKLANKVISEKVAEAVCKVNTVFVGEGFMPIANAGAYLQSISTEEIKGFIDPMAQAVLAANGQHFQPVGAPDSLYGKGHLGNFQGVEYEAERFLKPLTVDADFTGVKSGALTTSGPSGDGLYVTLTAKPTGTVKKGTPIFVDGYVACDTIGDPTSVPFAFIAAEDCDFSDGNLIKVEDVVLDDIGARQAAWTGLGTATAHPNADVKIPEAGTYRLAYIRANGAYNFSEVKELDMKLSDKGAVGDVDGVRISVNSFTDGINAVNTTRWDWAYLAGTVEPRLCTLAMFKM